MREVLRVTAMARRTVLTGLLGLALVATPVGAAQADEGAGRAFVARASASGVHLQYGIENFLVVEEFIDGSGPTAQGVLNSDGTRQGFASLPYPGPIAMGYPGYVALVAGSAAPGYPLYSASAYPGTPNQSVADPTGGYRLDSKSDERAVVSEARFGAPGDKAAGPITRATSQVVQDGQSVIATATSLSQGLSLGPLSIGLVRSQSTTTYRPGDDRPVAKTELVVEGGRAGDLTFRFGREGLQVAQQGVPLPAGDGLKALNSVLAPAGLTVSFADSRPLDGGAAAGSLEIVSKRDVPGAGPGTLRIAFGQATSVISLGGPSDAEGSGQ